MAIHVNDTYTWCVIHQDRTKTPEFDAMNTIGRGWAERGSKPVQSITLARVLDGTVVQSIDIPEGAEPVFFRRRFIALNPVTGEGDRKTVHCIGWTRGEEAAYLFVDDNGGTLLTSDFQAI